MRSGAVRRRAFRIGFAMCSLLSTCAIERASHFSKWGRGAKPNAVGSTECKVVRSTLIGRVLPLSSPQSLSFCLRCSKGTKNVEIEGVEVEVAVPLEDMEVGAEVAIGETGPE